MEILNKRPENMSYQDYRKHLKAQKAWLTERLKGKIIYVASFLKIERDATGMVVSQEYHKNPQPYVKPKVV